MVIEWLAGNRLRGTTAERPSASLQSPSVGGWVELGRTTLGSAGDTITVSSLPDKRYYMVLANSLDTGGTIGMNPRLNSDTGSNYSSRQSQNGAADNTQTSLAQARWADTNASDNFGVLYLANYSTNEKLMLSHSVQQSTAGAGTAPIRFENVSKHAQTSNPVNAFAIQNFGTGSYASGSEVVVLGWDPADTHTTNFWEELASATAGGGTETFETDTFTAKKYLWVQAWIDSSGSNRGLDFYVNSDTSTNYAQRYSNNGSSDATVTSDRQMMYGGGFSGTEKFFMNIFIINNSSNEKLSIGHVITDAGSTGAANAPTRREVVGKWNNTSTQITKVGFKNRSTTTGQNIDSGSIIKVWGAD